MLKINRIPLEVDLNGFKEKSLSNFCCNIAEGCTHGCTFCYVPSLQRGGDKRLTEYDVTSITNQWGEYFILRPWDDDAFRSSVRSAEGKVGLPEGGRRAVIFCSTTDPYQVPPRAGMDFNRLRRNLVRNALTVIREDSTLNVRILTRSPLAEEDFELMKSFGDRLTFGMSLPTLDNNLARIYEPRAPAPTRRLETLRRAKYAGLHVYVAIAPTYPECNEADVRRTIEAVAALEPLTIFYEPINLRGQNVDRIRRNAEESNRTLDLSAFESVDTWRLYSLRRLVEAQRIAGDLGVLNRLHLWPDKNLLRKTGIARLWKSCPREFGSDQAWEQVKGWIERWHARISEWPGVQPQEGWEVPRLSEYPALEAIVDVPEAPAPELAIAA